MTTYYEAYFRKTIVSTLTDVALDQNFKLHSLNGIALGVSTGVENYAILSANTTTKGFLFPRLSTIERNLLTYASGLVVYDKDLSDLYVAIGTTWQAVGGGGVGDVVGVTTSSDNALVRYDGTTGKLIQKSSIIVDDNANITGVNSLTTTEIIATIATIGAVRISNAGIISGVTTLTATNINTNSIVATTGTFSNLIATAGTIGSVNLNSGNVTGVNNLIATAATIGSINLNANNIINVNTLTVTETITSTATIGTVNVANNGDITGVNNLTATEINIATATIAGNYYPTSVATLGYILQAGSTGVLEFASIASIGSGDVTSITTSLDSALVRYSGVSGKVIKNTNITVDDNANISGISNLTATEINVVAAATIAGNYYPNAIATAGYILQASSNGVLSFTTFVIGGNVEGPATATDTAIAIYNGTSGKVIQNSNITISTTNSISGVATLSATNVKTNNLVATNATIFNLNSTVGTITDLAVTIGTIGSVSFNAGTVLGITDLTATAGTIGSVNLNSGTVTGISNLTATAATIAANYYPTTVATAGYILQASGNGVLSFTTFVIGGNVVGPATASNTAIALYNGTSGKLIQNSNVTIDATNDVSGIATLTATNVKINNLIATTGIIANLVVTAATIGANYYPTLVATASYILQASSNGVLNFTTFTASGSGNVVGPATATDTAIAIYSGATGKIIQNCGVIIDSNSNIVLSNTSGTGIKVNIASPAFGWKDLIGNISLRGNGVNNPTWTVYRGNIFQYLFDLNAEVWHEFHMPHDYVPNSDMYIHTHWSHNATDVTTGGVAWTFDVSYAKGYNRDAFSAPVSLSVPQSASTIQYQHMIAETQLSAASPTTYQLNSANLETDGLILVRCYLSANTLSEEHSVFVHYIDIHYQSTQTATKNRNYPFYA